MLVLQAAHRVTHVRTVDGGYGWCEVHCMSHVCSLFAHVQYTAEAFISVQP